MRAHPRRMIPLFLPVLLLAGLSLSLDSSTPAASDSFCPGNYLANGGFEQGETGWTQATSGEGPKCHLMIGDWEWCRHDGEYCARLGGYEGVSDSVYRTVYLPYGAQLSYWWTYSSFEPPEEYWDFFSFEVIDENGKVLARTGHSLREEENVWRQDTLDLSAYAGQKVTIAFYAYNDNYYFSTWGVDSVCLTRSSLQPPYQYFFPQMIYQPNLTHLIVPDHLQVPTPYFTPTPYCR